MSAIGTEQTWASALHTSAFDPKRTWRGPTICPAIVTTRDLRVLCITLPTLGIWEMMQTDIGVVLRVQRSLELAALFSRVSRGLRFSNISCCDC